MQDKGFIKVPRGCVFQDIFKDRQVFYFYFMLLYLARYKAGVVDGIFVNEGQVLITKKKLAEYAALPEKNVRSILDRFEKYGCITKQNVKNKYTLITILPVFSDGKPLEKIGTVKRNSGKNKKEIYYPEESEGISGGETVKEENALRNKEHFGKLNTEAKTEEERKKIKSDVDINSDIKKEASEKKNSLSSAEIIKKVSQKVTDDYENGHNASRAEKNEADINIIHRCENDSFQADSKTANETNSTQRFFSENSKRLFENAFSEKIPHGKFMNIYLTPMQYEELKAMTASYDIQIEKLSAYLKANPARKYEDHFALLCLNIENERLTDSRRKCDEECTPDSTASYDIKRAELRARTTVPVVKKRNRETGEWECVKKNEA